MALSNPVWQDIYFLYHHSILVTQVATSTVSLGKMIWQDTGNYIKSAVSTAGSYIKSAVNSAKNYVKSAVNSAKTYVKNAVSSVKSYVGGSSYKTRVVITLNI